MMYLLGRPAPTGASCLSVREYLRKPLSPIGASCPSVMRRLQRPPGPSGVFSPDKPSTSQPKSGQQVPQDFSHRTSRGPQSFLHRPRVLLITAGLLPPRMRRLPPPVHDGPQTDPVHSSLRSALLGSTLLEHYHPATVVLHQSLLLPCPCGRLFLPWEAQSRASSLQRR